jgi:hypothetical protein
VNSVDLYFQVLLRESRSRDCSLIIVARFLAGRTDESWFDPGRRSFFFFFFFFHSVQADNGAYRASCMSCCPRGRTVGGVKLTNHLYSVPRLSSWSLCAPATLCFYVACFLIQAQGHIYLYLLPCEVLIRFDLYIHLNEKRLILELTFFFYKCDLGQNYVFVKVRSSCLVDHQLHGGHIFIFRRD